MRASSDHVWVAGQMLEGLRARPETRHLPPCAVAVITDQDGARLDTRHRAVVDRSGSAPSCTCRPTQIASGSIRADRLSPASRNAWTLVAAAVAEVCARPSVHDYRPSEARV